MAGRQKTAKWTAAMAIGLFCATGPTMMGTAHAQTTNAAVAAANLPRMNLGRVPARDVAKAVSSAARVRIVADRSVAFQNVDWASKGGTLVEVLNELIAALPKTTALRVVYLPKEMAEADADAIALYLASVENLKNSSEKVQTAVVRPPVAAPTETANNGVNASNLVEVMGRRLTSEKAAPLVAALDLVPIYLIARPFRVGDPVARLGDMQTELIGLWMRMSPEQRKQSAEQQFDSLINMDSAARRALFGSQAEQGQMFLQKLQNLPKDQSRQFWMDMTGGKFDGTGLPKVPPAGGGTNP